MAFAIGLRGSVPNFKCSNCGAVHPFTEANNAALHESGTIAHFPWYRQDDGLNVNATICLACGTVHATAFGSGKALFSLGRRVWRVQYYLPPDRLVALIREHGSPLPKEATDMLFDRGLLSAPLGAEGANLMRMALFTLGVFCEVVRGSRFDGDSVEAFMRQAREPRRSEQLGGSASLLGSLLDGEFTASDVAEMARNNYHTLRNIDADETSIKLDIAHAFSMFLYYCSARKGGVIDVRTLQEFLHDARDPLPNKNPSGMEEAADTIDSFLTMFATPEDIVREAMARREGAGN